MASQLGGWSGLADDPSQHDAVKTEAVAPGPVLVRRPGPPWRVNDNGEVDPNGTAVAHEFGLYCDCPDCRGFDSLWDAAFDAAREVMIDRVFVAFAAGIVVGAALVLLWG